MTPEQLSDLSANPEYIKPCHEICETNVDIPTISLKEFSEGDKKWEHVVVQWYGEAGKLLSPENQFKFSIMANPDSVYWWDHPEWFKVLFLGKVKDWPNPKAVQELANGLTRGNLESWVIYVTTDEIGVNYGKGDQPLAFACPIAVLGDPIVGIISPKSFTNLDIAAKGSYFESLRNRVLE